MIVHFKARGIVVPNVHKDDFPIKQHHTNKFTISPHRIGQTFIAAGQTWTVTKEYLTTSTTYSPAQYEWAAQT